MATPFRLVVPLLTPVSLNAPWIFLDSVVSHLVQLALLGRRFFTLPTKRVLKFRGEHRYSRVLLYESTGLAHASCAQFENAGGIAAISMYKRLEESGFPGRKKVNLGSGHFRNWCLRTCYIPASTAVFYGCGDIELLRELLDLLTHLGNDVRVGWGRVDTKNIRIEPQHKDTSIVRRGKAMRPIPVCFLRRYSDAVYLPWRSPYWASENVELCAPPGAEVELK